MDLFFCEMCGAEMDISQLDAELGMCTECLAKLRLDFKEAKDKPANKYRIKDFD